MKANKEMTLLAFLRKELEVSGKKLKSALEGGACRVNGVIERFAGTVLQKGDTVSFDHTLLTKPSTPQSLPILYQDQDLMICNKPAGVVSDRRALMRLVDEELFLVHRLDKETSGALLLAKNQRMQKEIEARFRKREVTKIYFALCSGKVKEAEGTIKNMLEKKREYQGQSIWGRGKNGLLATTHWKRVKQGKKTTLLQCQPVTGRTHQIRVHLSEMGHPILGDLLYGRNVPFPEGLHRLLLHAYQIVFTHPKTGETMTQTAPIPKEFSHFLG